MCFGEVTASTALKLKATVNGMWSSAPMVKVNIATSITRKNCSDRLYLYI